MNRILAFCVGTLVIAGLTSCNQAPAPVANAVSNNHDADVQAIRALETQWLQDYAAKDAAKVSAVYADDATLMMSAMPAASGKDAILKLEQQMLADPALDLKFQADKVDVAGSGDLGYAHGTYTVTYTDPQTKKIVNEHGSYLTNYRKQADGSWKAIEDISTPDAPAKPVAGAKAKH